MPYAVTLPLDDAGARPIREMWRVLADQMGDDDSLTLGYGPHITLAVLPDAVPVDQIEAAVKAVSSTWQALPVTLAGFGVFPGNPGVVWAGPVVTQDLLAVHAGLVACLSPLAVDPHYQFGAWVPHVTLSKVGVTSAGRTLEVLTPLWTGPIGARLERIELVRFRPVEIVVRQAFRRQGYE